MAKTDLASINRGRLRHPLFGDREHWYDQKVKAGFWDRAMEEGAPDIHKALIGAVDRAMELLSKKI